MSDTEKTAAETPFEQFMKRYTGSQNAETMRFSVEEMRAAFTYGVAAGGQIPGSEAFPKDVPDAPHGDVSLEYNVQNFNALVAANTTMQTEISSLMERAANGEQEAAHLREVIAESLKPAIDALKKAVDDQERLIQRHEERAGKQKTEIEWERANSVSLQRRLDRAMGYLDAKLDYDAGISAPSTQTVPAAQPSVGPRLDEIEVPRRPRDGDKGPWSVAGRVMGEPYSAERYRRY